MNFYNIIEEHLMKGKKGVLATVISRSGSAPRDVGAKMFVSEDGITYETIGGGRLEYNAIKEAMALMGSEGPKMLHIRMDAKEVASDGMICGGNVDVLLEPVLPKYSDLYSRLKYLEKRGKKGVLTTRFDGGAFSKTLIEEDMSVWGDDVPVDTIGVISPYLSETRPFVVNGLVIEPVYVSAALYIFGAGHVSQHIAKIAKTVDFSVTVIDDRQEFANWERFPDADAIMVDHFTDVFDKISFTGREFVAIVTRGHQHDADVLREALKKPTRYVGMIGSKRKVDIIFKHMEEEGFDSATIKKVYAPIGLPIHAETPQEIAVSIIAELIKVRGE